MGGGPCTTHLMMSVRSNKESYERKKEYIRIKGE
jgi:hypothetical protein